MKQRTETGLSHKSLNDATVKALFRMLESLEEEAHVANMHIDNKTIDQGLYKVELTAIYELRNSPANRVTHFQERLSEALRRNPFGKKKFRDMPAGMVAHMYEEHDIDLDDNQSAGARH